MRKFHADTEHQFLTFNGTEHVPRIKTFKDLEIGDKSTKVRDNMRIRIKGAGEQSRCIQIWAFTGS